jgi:tRNA pseudouridine65 synthase
VLLLARDPATASGLGAAFAAGTVVKTYLALVRGRPAAAGRIDHPLPRREGGDRVPATTLYRTLATSPVARCSLLEARPVTGRPHQIRRHLKHISHPLVGDVRWGKGDVNREYREKFGLHRLALHAASVCVPWRGEELLIESPPPPELSAAWQALGCWPLPEPGPPSYCPGA